MSFRIKKQQQQRKMKLSSQKKPKESSESKKLYYKNRTINGEEYTKLETNFQYPNDTSEDVREIIQTIFELFKSTVFNEVEKTEQIDIIKNIINDIGRKNCRSYHLGVCSGKKHRIYSHCVMNECQCSILIDLKKKEISYKGLKHEEIEKENPSIMKSKKKFMSKEYIIFIPIKKSTIEVLEKFGMRLPDNFSDPIVVDDK